MTKEKLLLFKYLSQRLELASKDVELFTAMIAELEELCGKEPKKEESFFNLVKFPGQFKGDSK